MVDRPRQRIRYEHAQPPRLALAFVVAPLLPVVIVSGWMGGWDFGQSAYVSRFVALFIYPGVLLVGGPAYWILSRWMRPNLIASMLVGGALALLPLPFIPLPQAPPRGTAVTNGAPVPVDGSTTLGIVEHFMLFYSPFVLVSALGALGGFVFWLLASRRVTSAPAS